MVHRIQPDACGMVFVRAQSSMSAMTGRAYTLESLPKVCSCTARRTASGPKPKYEILKSCRSSCGSLTLDVLLYPTGGPAK